MRFFRATQVVGAGRTGLLALLFFNIVNFDDMTQVAGLGNNSTMQIPPVRQKSRRMVSGTVPGWALGRESVEYSLHKKAR